MLVWLVIAIVVAGGTAGGLLWFFGWPHLPTAAVFDVTQLLDLLKIALSVVAGFGGVVCWPSTTASSGSPRRSTLSPPNSSLTTAPRCA
ncbi:hypothetical protein ACGFMK_09110 [Amycolatopsis sp. NPDC049252]|uniref:hypothetical protein n=1 Tax=Amycolatopsis sp. NPDC049252 TaxID=3363933 RepID=UPI00371B3418